ncbi:MAG TPA: hypothetical protein VMO26_22115 [Vicinamibacterales bacterium]|nr:hypothetical protein [Vicinamibacterales bacterium]
MAVYQSALADARVSVDEKFNAVRRASQQLSMFEPAFGFDDALKELQRSSAAQSQAFAEVLNRWLLFAVLGFVAAMVVFGVIQELWWIAG